MSLFAWSGSILSSRQLLISLIPSSVSQLDTLGAEVTSGMLYPCFSPAITKSSKDTSLFSVNWAKFTNSWAILRTTHKRIITCCTYLEIRQQFMKTCFLHLAFVCVHFYLIDLDLFFLRINVQSLHNSSKYCQFFVITFSICHWIEETPRSIGTKSTFDERYVMRSFYAHDSKEFHVQSGIVPFICGISEKKKGITFFLDFSSFDLLNLLTVLLIQMSFY